MIIYRHLRARTHRHTIFFQFCLLLTTTRLTFPFHRVYIVRLRGEKHSETQGKLQAIVNSLFPKNQKHVIPKEAPVNIFVRIIQFIAHVSAAEIVCVCMYVCVSDLRRLSSHIFHSFTHSLKYILYQSLN